MITVGDVSYSISSFDHSSSSSQQGKDILRTLMQNPGLKRVSFALDYTPGGLFSLTNNGGFLITPQTKSVFILQKEYATVDPSFVDVVGTHGMSTCVGLIIQNPKSGKISVAHIDVLGVIEIGINQMLSSVDDQDINDVTNLNVHLIGGYNDEPEWANHEDEEKREGVSFPICSKIIEVLCKSTKTFHLRTLHVLDHNTIYDRQGIGNPKFGGFVVETGVGSIFPAMFDETTKGPDEMVREVRRLCCHYDPSWDGRLLDTYDNLSDHYVIAPCSWGRKGAKGFGWFLSLSDREFADNYYFTPPAVLNRNEINYLRGIFAYIFNNPEWKKTFPGGRPRVFARIDCGGWKQKEEKMSQIFKRSAN
ncbi:unnamed protein product [Cuscuta europaea]|uniref:Uncharacterized protein n=1 Tax=Cuscuta europaea TaxID=41803 RepID=A0A9P0ZC86_CUSEU|nr:unnamed protein product [Cuscuta europaea]